MNPWSFDEPFELRPPEGFNDALRDRLNKIIQRGGADTSPSDFQWSQLGTLVAEFNFENSFLSGSDIKQLWHLATKARAFSKALDSLSEGLKFVVGYDLSGVSKSGETDRLPLLQDMVSHVAAIKPKSPGWIEERDIKLEKNLSKWWKEVTGSDPTIWMEPNADGLYSPYSEMMKEISRIFHRPPACSPASQRNRRKAFGDHDVRRAAVQDARSKMVEELGKKLIEIRARLNLRDRTDR